METTENTSAKAEQEQTTDEEQGQPEAGSDNVENLNAEANDSSEQNEFKEKYYYLAAEMQNMQKRFDKDRENLLKYGNEKVLKDLIDIVDNFERTLSFIEKEEDEKVKNIVVGIEMIQKLLLETLTKHGLKKIEALGEEFDPNFHEALAQQPAEGKKDNEVILVHQNGYILNERVLRAAKVIIAKN